MPLIKRTWRHRQYCYTVGRSGMFLEQLSGSLVDFLAGVITIAPSLTFALSGTSALPRVLAFAGSEPVLRLVDVAVNHKLSRLLVLVPVGSVKGLLIWEHLVDVIRVSSRGAHGGGGNQGDKGNFHHFFIVNQIYYN